MAPVQAAILVPPSSGVPNALQHLNQHRESICNRLFFHCSTDNRAAASIQPDTSDFSRK
jgi:hypothetical protein